MIQSNELRIGNFVYAQSNKLIKDVSTTFKIRIVTPQEEYKWQPIPLSPEILEKCGFEKREWDNGLTSGVKLTKEVNDFYLEYETFAHTEDVFNLCSGADYCDLNITKTCKYLHQLQNLYYALTQTELEINL